MTDVCNYENEVESQEIHTEEFSLSDLDEESIQIPEGLERISKEDEWERHVGEEVPEDEFLRDHLRSSDLHAETTQIANILEANNYHAYLDDRKTVVSPTTGETKEILSLRHLQIFPLVAYRDAQESRERLEGFIQHESADGLFSVVISDGWKPVNEYRYCHIEFRKKLAKACAWLRRNGFEPIFSNIERTPQVKEGESYVNLHSHMLIRQDDAGSLERMNRYLFDNFHWSPTPKSVSQGDVSAMAAYFHKPDKLLKPGFDIVTLARQQKGLRFRQPLGSFRKYVSEQNAEDERDSPNPDGSHSVVSRYETKANPLGYQPTHLTCNRVLRLTRPMTIGNDRKKVVGLVVQNYDGDFEALMKTPYVKEFVEHMKQLTSNKVLNTVTRTKHESNDDDIPF